MDAQVFIIPKCLDFLYRIYYIVEVTLTKERYMGGDLGLAWDVLQPLIYWGVTAGVVLAIIFGAIKIGWKFAPWIVGLAFLVWFFS